MAASTFGSMSQSLDYVSIQSIAGLFSSYTFHLANAMFSPKSLSTALMKRTLGLDEISSRKC